MQLLLEKHTSHSICIEILVLVNTKSKTFNHHCHILVLCIFIFIHIFMKFVSNNIYCLLMVFNFHFLFLKD